MNYSNLKDEFYRHTQMSSSTSVSWEERLFQAIIGGDVRNVKALLNKGVNVNAIHPSGRTPLGTAAHLGNIEVLKVLLEPSPNCCVKEKDLTTIRKLNTDYCEKLSLKEGSKSKGRKNVLSSVERRRKAARTGSLSSDEVSDGEDEIQGISTRVKTKRNDKPLGDSGEISPCHLDNSANEYSNQTLSDVFKNKESNSCYKSESNKEGIKMIQSCPNQGYFVVVHNDFSEETNSKEEASKELNFDESVNEPKTPDGMDNLEWDSELQSEVSDVIEGQEDADSWIDLYRWYADYLANSCAVDKSVQHSTSLKIDVNQLDMYRRSAMHYAAEQGNMEVLRLLISAGSCVDLGDSDDVTPLHLAAARDNPSVVALLISCGAKVNRKSIDGTGPLHMAAARGFLETAGILLDQGASVNSLDRSDRTPLHLAVSRGLEEMVKLLISHGAKVNIEDILGYTPLCQAVWQQEKDIVCLLLEAGAKLTHSDRLLHCAILHRCPEIAKLLVSAGSIVNLRDDNGDTPLIIAARSGQIDMVDMLLRNGAMASYPNGLTGSTPLHEAVECLRPAQYTIFQDILLCLLSYCGPSGLLNLESSSVFDVPLVRALVHDRDHAIIILIQHGADVNPLQQHTPVVSEMYLQKRPNRLVIAQLMILAGLDLWKFTPSIQADVKYPKDSPASWIASMKFNPLTLADLSRIRFRRTHGENLYKALSRSRLPASLRKLIMLEDVVNVDDYHRSRQGTDLFLF